ncbi:PAS domain-containing protein [Pelagicoccus mobilis]|nr:PAS domain-containing protein [Pelagicoccus mobilis]
MNALFRLFLLLTITTTPSAAASRDAFNLSEAELRYIESLPAIKVPFNDGIPPITFSRNETPSGYLNELLELALDSLGVSYERVEGLTYGESLQALENEEVDLLNNYSGFGASRDYVLQTSPVLTVPFVAVGSIEQDTVRNIEDLEGKKIALVEHFQQTKTIQSKYPEVDVLLVKSVEDGYRALRNKDADYYIDLAAHAGYTIKEGIYNDIKIAGEFSREQMGALELSFAIQQKHPLLHSAIQKALNKLSVREMGELKSRWSNYHSPVAPGNDPSNASSLSNSSSLDITAEEQAWLDRHQKVRVALGLGEPFSYMSEGTPQGLAYEYSKKLLTALGLELEVKQYTWSEARVLIEERREIDLIPMISRTKGREEHLNFSTDYLSFPIVVFKQKGAKIISELSDLNGQRVAIEKRYLFDGILRADYPGIELVTFPSTRSALEAVAIGEAEAYVGNLVSGIYMIEKYGLTNLQVAAPSGYEDPSWAFGVRKDWPELASLLSKALAKMTPKEHAELRADVFDAEYELGVRWPVIMKWGGGLVFLIGIGFYITFIWNRRLSREVQARIESEENLRKANDELAEREERYRTLVDNIPGVTFRCLPYHPWTMLFISSEVEALTGYPADDFLGESPKRQFGDLIHEDDVEQVSQVADAAIENKTDLVNEYRIVHSCGEIRYAYEKSQVILSENGEALFFDGTIFDNTDRVLAEKALKESEQQFRTLVGNIPGVTYRCLHQEPWPMIFISDGVEEFSGYPASDFMGEKPKVSFVDLIFADDLEQIQEAFERAVATRSAVSNEFRYYHASGELRYALDKLQVIFDDDDNILYLDGAMFDITDRKLTENQLKESQLRFELTVNGSGDGLWEYDSESETNWWSPVVYELLGYKENELSPDLESFAAVLHPDDVERVFAAFDAHLESDVPYDVEYRLRTKHGDYKWFRARAKSLRDESGKAYRTSGSLTDITKRKVAEYELQESQLRFELTVSGSGDGLWDVDHINDQLWWSPQFLNLLGYQNDEIKMAPEEWSNFLFDQDLERATTAYLNHLENDALYDIVYRMKHKDGSLVWLRARAKTLRDTEGKPIRTSGSVTNVTELIEAQKAAEEANNSKSNFLANMSHEIRTPMNAILGFTEILDKKINDKLQRKYLESIKSSGKTLLSLINDILDLSKVEAGKLDISYQSVDIAYVIEDMKSIFARKIDEKGLVFHADASEDLPKAVVLDETRVRQILINLIGNAIKFTDRGYVKVTLESEFHQDDMSKLDLIFSIEDTGMGIPEDQQSRIFGAFEQTKGQDINKFGGTGLGLAITSRLIELIHGEISLTSEVGKGTTFTVKIKDVSVASVADLDKANDSKIDPDKVSFSEATILVTDDIEVNRDLISGYLAEYRLKTIEAEDGQQAIDMALENRPDLILMDIKMPVMNGYDATERIKSEPETKDIPVVILTASSMDRSADKSAEISEGYLRKPVSRSELIEELMRFLPHAYAGETDVEETSAPEQNVEPSHVTEDYSEILSQLKQMAERTHELERMMSINDIEEFAQELKSIAEQHGFEQLLKTANALEEQAMMFEMDKISMTLKKLRELTPES